MERCNNCNIYLCVCEDLIPDNFVQDWSEENLDGLSDQVKKFCEDNGLDFDDSYTE
jgi:hypothetical protein